METCNIIKIIVVIKNVSGNLIHELITKNL